MANKQIERCFLCGRVEDEVNQLVKGRFGYVCDECIHEAYEVLNEEEQELLAMDNVKLEFEESALHRIAELAIKKEIGARGLRSIIEKCMKKIMYEIPISYSSKSSLYKGLN